MSYIQVSTNKIVEKFVKSLENTLLSSDFIDATLYVQDNVLTIDCKKPNQAETLARSYNLISQILYSLVHSEIEVRIICFNVLVAHWNVEWERMETVRCQLRDLHNKD